MVTPWPPTCHVRGRRFESVVPAFPSTHAELPRRMAGHLAILRGLYSRVGAPPPRRNCRDSGVGATYAPIELGAQSPAGVGDHDMIQMAWMVSFRQTSRLIESHQYTPARLRLPGIMANGLTRSRYRAFAAPRPDRLDRLRVRLRQRHNVSENRVPVPVIDG